MRHPLMIMMTMASALSQWVIRTVRGWTMMSEARCHRPAVMSVIVASRLFVDRREAGRFERRLRLRRLEKGHKALRVQLRIARLGDDIFDRRLIGRRQRHCQRETRGRVAGI